MEVDFTRNRIQRLIVLELLSLHSSSRFTHNIFDVIPHLPSIFPHASFTENLCSIFSFVMNPADKKLKIQSGTRGFFFAQDAEEVQR